MLGNKTYLKKFERIEAIQYLLSDHSGIKLETSNRMETENNPQICGDETTHF